MTGRLLDLRDLRVDYPGQGRSGRMRAVDGVSLHLAQGETLGLIGESGSGKSTIGSAVLGLIRPSAGRILYHGHDITRLTARERRHLGPRVQVIFQDPYGSLNPYRTIGRTLAEPLRVIHRMSRREATAQVVDALARVGLPADAAERHPRDFSGGQRQRIAIARALTVEPEMVICDEPTSALDVSVQAQILNLLTDLQERLGLAYLFISHDIDVVRHMSHRIAVLLHGRVVEEGPVERVIVQPCHDYTRALLADHGSTTSDDRPPMNYPGEQPWRLSRGS